MVDFIERSFSDRLTLRSVNAAVRGPPSQFGRIFQSQVGLSVHEYITRVRLDHTAQGNRGFMPRFGHKMQEMIQAPSRIWSRWLVGRGLALREHQRSCISDPSDERA